MATVYTDIFYHYEWCCNVIVGWIHIRDSLALGSCDKAFVHDQNITETIVTFHTMSRKQSNWRNVTSSSSWLKVSWQTRCQQTTDRWQLLIDNRQCLEGYNTIKIPSNITNYENATAIRFHSFWLRITSNNIFTLKPQCGHYTGNQEYRTPKKRVFFDLVLIVTSTNVSACNIQIATSDREAARQHMFGTEWRFQSFFIQVDISDSLYNIMAVA